VNAGQTGSEGSSVKLVIVHWNHPLECVAAIRSFAAQLRDLRIVILDNNSSTASYETLRKQTDSSVEILRLDENKGWGPALNIALRKWLNEETSSYCFISAHDAEAGPECLARLHKAMEADPRLGLVCPQYLDCSVPHFSALHGVAQKFVQPPRSDHVQIIDVPHGTLMIVRRECLADIGLFDERYFAYGDEHELGARARRHGWKVGLVWGATVANPQTSIADTWRSYLFARNSLLLVHDYFGKPAACLRALIILTNTARLAFLPGRDGFPFSARASWHGCRDYFANRFGHPPSP
jgi:N-acetylglucosaminyl-diphospho-decaprenol L-rhamnosyltransferase